MPEDLEAELLKWREKSSSKLVLSMKNGKALTKSAFRSLWRSVARTLRGRHFTPHSMRHTYITRLIESGVDIAYVQYLAGHSDERMTKKVYLHRDKALLAQNAVKAARDALSKKR